MSFVSLITQNSGEPNPSQIYQALPNSYTLVCKINNDQFCEQVQKLPRLCGHGPGPYYNIRPTLRTALGVVNFKIY